MPVTARSHGLALLPTQLDASEQGAPGAATQDSGPHGGTIHQNMLQGPGNAPAWPAQSLRTSERRHSHSQAPLVSREVRTPTPAIPPGLTVIRTTRPPAPECELPPLATATGGTDGLPIPSHKLPPRPPAATAHQLRALQMRLQTAQSFPSPGMGHVQAAAAAAASSNGQQPAVSGARQMTPGIAGVPVGAWMRSSLAASSPLSSVAPQADADRGLLISGSRAASRRASDMTVSGCLHASNSTAGKGNSHDERTAPSRGRPDMPLTLGSAGVWPGSVPTCTLSLDREAPQSTGPAHHQLLLHQLQRGSGAPVITRGGSPASSTSGSSALDTTWGLGGGGTKGWRAGLQVVGNIAPSEAAWAGSPSVSRSSPLCELAPEQVEVLDASRCSTGSDNGMRMGATNQLSQPGPGGGDDAFTRRAALLRGAFGSSAARHLVHSQWASVEVLDPTDDIGFGGTGRLEDLEPGSAHHAPSGFAPNSIINPVPDQAATSIPVQTTPLDTSPQRVPGSRKGHRPSTAAVTLEPGMLARPVWRAGGAPITPRPVTTSAGPSVTSAIPGSRDWTFLQGSAALTTHSTGWRKPALMDTTSGTTFSHAKEIAAALEELEAGDMMGWGPAPMQLFSNAEGTTEPQYSPTLQAHGLGLEQGSAASGAVRKQLPASISFDAQAARLATQRAQKRAHLVHIKQLLKTSRPMTPAEAVEVARMRVARKLRQVRQRWHIGGSHSSGSGSSSDSYESESSDEDGSEYDSEAQEDEESSGDGGADSQGEKGDTVEGDASQSSSEREEENRAEDEQVKECRIDEEAGPCTTVQPSAARPTLKAAPEKPHTSSVYTFGAPHNPSTQSLQSLRVSTSRGSPGGSAVSPQASPTHASVSMRRGAPGLLVSGRLVSAAVQRGSAVYQSTTGQSPSLTRSVSSKQRGVETNG